MPKFSDQFIRSFLGPGAGDPDYYKDADDEFTVVAWQAEVAAGDTRMGYHAWASGHRSLADAAAQAKEASDADDRG